MGWSFSYDYDGFGVYEPLIILFSSLDLIILFTIYMHMYIETAEEESLFTTTTHLGKLLYISLNIL